MQPSYCSPFYPSLSGLKDLIHICTHTLTYIHRYTHQARTHTSHRMHREMQRQVNIKASLGINTSTLGSFYCWPSCTWHKLQPRAHRHARSQTTECTKPWPLASFNPSKLQARRLKMLLSGFSSVSQREKVDIVTPSFSARRPRQLIFLLLIVISWQQNMLQEPSKPPAGETEYGFSSYSS